MQPFIFINFINNEINRIDEELAKNENVNVLYEIKNTKFGIEKYAPNIRNNNKKDEIIPLNEEKSKVLNISDKWLTQKGNNCRYNAFITLFYFTISSSLEKIEDNNLICIIMFLVSITLSWIFCQNPGQSEIKDNVKYSIMYLFCFFYKWFLENFKLIYLYILKSNILLCIIYKYVIVLYLL